MPLTRLVIVSVVLVVVGCKPYVNDVPDDPTKRQYFHKSDEEQAKEFEKCSMEEQFQLVRYGCHRRHPQDWGVIKRFAGIGPSIIPFLTIRLETTQSDSEVYDISNILFEVTIEKKPYGPAYDPELLKLLCKRANGMQPGARRELTLETIARIEKHIQERLESATVESQAKSNDSRILDQEKHTTNENDKDSDLNSGKAEE